MLASPCCLHLVGGSALGSAGLSRFFRWARAFGLPGLAADAVRERCVLLGSVPDEVCAHCGPLVYGVSLTAPLLCPADVCGYHALFLLRSFLRRYIPG